MLSDVGIDPSGMHGYIAPTADLRMRRCARPSPSLLVVTREWY